MGWVQDPPHHWGRHFNGDHKALRWTSFEPLGELEAGVTAAKPGGSDLLVISKAGGFGDVEVLRRVLDRIQN